MSTFPREVLLESIADDLDTLVRTWAFAAVKVCMSWSPPTDARQRQKHFFTVTAASANTTAPTTPYQISSGAYLIMIGLYVHVLRKRGLGQNRLLASAIIALFVLCTAHCVLVLAAVATRTSLELRLILHLAGGPVPHGRLPLLVPTAGGLSLAANVVYVTAKCVPHVSRGSLLIGTYIALPKCAS
jgi:hypothetical protein